MNLIPIVFSIDHNYVMQAGVCIYSLLENATCGYDIYILVNNDVVEKDKQLLHKQVGQFSGHRLSFINVGDVFSSSYEVRGISVAAYSRLLIPWLLPDYDKVIYSDVDVIFKLSLEEIYRHDISNFYFGAIKGAYFQYNKKARLYVKQLGLDPDNYVNSGFLLINSKLQREHNLRDSFISQSGNKYTYQDQDIINIVAKGRIDLISPRYCITPAFYKLLLSNDSFLSEYYGSEKEISDYAEGLNCIIHYAGDKPWNAFTFAWTDWWTTYRKSVFCRAITEIKLSEKILSGKSPLKSLYWKIRRLF